MVEEVLADSDGRRNAEMTIGKMTRGEMTEGRTADTEIETMSWIDIKTGARIDAETRKRYADIHQVLGVEIRSGSGAKR